ncbi:winged helix-turn-helix domain-containing tetratricopeptide repeat protein [Defluviimonas salinarum]|uniref:Winged helix-turn-helix domain-containing protein n=1 Tax=Defluviimonas salinarum TaxID=2992147 RepID=A0ABT3J6W9_9RHOB|nr:winged helix-turn-helix domain-containing protein [Defluviimonas salinarum]MCW3783417.1 winged helix-turn-helix domain-containing protein [Defluviimonas salinarum]
MDRQFGPYRLKLAARQLVGPEGPVVLSARAFDILALLLDTPDEVVGKSTLLDAVWPGLMVEENTLQVHMSALRKALDDGMIATVHGRGYKYSGPRPVAVEATDDQFPNGSAEGGAASQPKPSIAVLPFDNMSGDPEQSYFSDGITEDIIAELGRFKEFLVIARNSSFQFRGAVRDVTDVAKTLGVQYVVEGSVRKTGNRVRVSVQLIDAARSIHVWGEHYDRDLTDIFAIQDEITQMIATRLARQARTAIASRARARPTDNMSAYECYLRALQLSANYDYDSVCKAEPVLRQAIELDPKFAAAYAMLGFVETLKFFWNTKQDDLQSGLTIARTALQLDPDEAYGHLAAGFALVYLHRFRQAEASLDRAVSLNPNDPFILTVHAVLLHFTSKAEMALERLDDAQRRDPFAVEWYGDFRGIALTTAGRYREAVACYEKLDNVTPWSLAYLTVCYAELGETALAKGSLAKLRSHWPEESIDEIIDHEMDYFEDPAVCSLFRSVLRCVDNGQ